MNIETNEMRGGPYINISGGELKYKFSIHELKGVYTATASNTNSELIQFLDSLPSLYKREIWDKGYWGWKMNPTEVITVISAVIREFE